jgi:uncharacterized protein (DUF924 family)
MPDGVDEVLEYWLGPEPTTTEQVQQRMKLWFGGGAETDREIRERFTTLVQKAKAGELDAWAETPRGTLALVILLDQFTRNVYRGSPEAFVSDPKALALSREGHLQGRFASLGTFERMFATMPLRHAEDVEAQKLGVALAVRDTLEAPELLRAFMVRSVDSARDHLDVIVRFGRFPHRNAVLGRDSTPEEKEYLEYLKLAGQWL